MALSNIFREPRREITETAVGLAAVVGIVAIVLPADYFLAQWFYQLTGGKHGGCPWQIGMFLVPLLLIVVCMLGGALIIGLPIAIHAIGDGLCGALERRGVQVRPRQRY